MKTILSCCNCGNMPQIGTETNLECACSGRYVIKGSKMRPETAKWESVMENMPSPYDDVVFLDSTAERIDGQKHLGYFDGVDWLSGDDETVVKMVSHWIKLPSSAAVIDKMLGIE